MNYCFENAGKSCGADGYTIVGRDGSLLATSDVADDDLDTLEAAYQENSNSILIRCGS